MNRLGIFFIFLLFLFSAHLKAADETMQRVTIGVSGMMKSKTGITWMSWPNAVEAALSELPGVSAVKVDLLNDAFTVSYDEAVVRTQTLFIAIEALGYAPSILQSDLLDARTLTERGLPESVLALVNATTPIFIYFGARWCGACKIMERTTFADDSVSVALAEFNYLKIDIEEETETATAFNIAAVPTVIVLDAEANELYRHVGPLSAYEMRLVLDEFANTVD
jgi:copper chaperone CopZ